MRALIGAPHESTIRMGALERESSLLNIMHVPATMLNRGPDLAILVFMSARESIAYDIASDDENLQLVNRRVVRDNVFSPYLAVSYIGTKWPS